jgi:hypothetical protein
VPRLRHRLLYTHPPDFGFSAGFIGPTRSIAGHLIWPNDAIALLGAQPQPHVSRVVVSKALARSRTAEGAPGSWPAILRSGRARRRPRGLPVSNGQGQLRGTVHISQRPAGASDLAVPRARRRRSAVRHTIQRRRLAGRAGLLLRPHSPGSGAATRTPQRAAAPVLPPPHRLPSAHAK